MVILLLPFIYWIVGFAPIRAAIKQFKSLLIIFVVLSIIGLLGAFVGAIFVNTDLMLVNVFAIFRLLFDCLLIYLTVVLVGFYRLGIYSALSLGLVISCLLNLVDWMGRGMAYESLAGQNTLGFVIALGFPYILFRLLFRSVNIYRLVMNLLVVLIVVVSGLLTWSKGAWIGMLITTTILVIYWGAASVKKSITAIVLVMAVSFIATEFFGSQLYKLVETEITASAGSASNEMREVQILNGILIGLEYPFGVGNKTYYTAARSLGLEFVSGGTPPDPHNSYVHVMSGFGLIGLIPYLLIMFYPMYILLRVRALMPARDFVMQCVVLISIYFQGMVTGEVFTQPLAWVLMGSCLGVSWAYTQRKS